MSKLTMGQVVRAKRELLDWSRKKLARKVGITPAFLGHVENDAPVHVSDRLAGALSRHLKVGLGRTLREPQMKRRQRWVRSHRKTAKKARRKSAKRKR